MSSISWAFRTFNGHSMVLYRARRSAHYRMRARECLQCRFRAGIHQSVPISASREQHRVCSGSVFEPQLVESLDLEVGEDAARAALSSRTSCNGACCAGKHHQSTLSSIQRHRRVPIRQPKREVFPYLLPSAKSFCCAVFKAARPPTSVVQQCSRARSTDHSRMETAARSRR